MSVAVYPLALGAGAALAGLTGLLWAGFAWSVVSVSLKIDGDIELG